MNVRQLLTNVRARLLDTIGVESERYWSDIELIDDYANTVRTRMFQIVRKLVVDSSTVADASALPLCKIDLIAGTGAYDISSKIISIIELRLNSQSDALDVITLDDMNARGINWRTMPDGAPLYYCLGLNTDSIQFLPAPAINDTAYLTVYRYPLLDLTRDPNAALGFREEYHPDLVTGILAMAFAKQDSEIAKMDLSGLYEKKFLDRCAEIKLDCHRRITPPHRNRMVAGLNSK